MEPLKTAMLCALLECTEKELNEFIESANFVLGSEISELIAECKTAGLEPIRLSDLEYMLNHKSKSI